MTPLGANVKKEGVGKGSSLHLGSYYAMYCVFRFSACSSDAGTVTAFSSTLEETTCDVGVV